MENEEPEEDDRYLRKTTILWTPGMILLRMS